MASEAFQNAKRVHRDAGHELNEARKEFDRTVDNIKNLERELKTPGVFEADLMKMTRTLNHYEDVLCNQRRNCQELKQGLNEAHAFLQKAYIAYKEVRPTYLQARAAKKAAESRAREAFRENVRRNEERRRERFEHTSLPPKAEESNKEKTCRYQGSPAKKSTSRERKGKTPKGTINEWRARVNDQLADYTNMTCFPTPPSVAGCFKDSCVAKAADRVLESCDCQIETAFDNAADVNLKLERYRWHPDRFSACPEENREEWVKMAAEVFRVVNGMWVASQASG